MCIDNNNHDHENIIVKLYIQYYIFYMFFRHVHKKHTRTHMHIDMKKYWKKLYTISSPSHYKNTYTPPLTVLQQENHIIIILLLLHTT